MEVKEVLRVVISRKGRVKPADFKLRPGETGLSLFAHLPQPTPADVIEAVRAAGKQGELAVALLPADAIRALGLRLVKTKGGTPVAEVNAIHYEARVPFWRRPFAWLRGMRTHDYFNRHFSTRLCDIAELLEE